jgi:glycosyltransferase involved in cell wall biosynthesis
MRAMIPPSDGASSALRIALLHNYREEQQPSMRLYADRLGDALVRQGVHVARVRPPELVPDPWRRRSWMWKKIDDYGGRHVVYPRLLRGLSADVVHVADHSQGFLIAQLDERRTVVTCHDLILLQLAAGRLGDFPIPRVALQIFRMSLALTKRAASIVADSTQTKRDLVDLVGIDPAKVRVIFPGLNQTFAPSPERGLAFRRRSGLGQGPLILQLGRNFYKNISAVLRVLGRLRRDGVDARVVRTGQSLGGDDRALVERLGISSSIVELGAVSDADIPALYNAVDLLLFPSLYEGFGWPPLEAMASGTPVVSSRAGSLDEIVGDAALTADPDDIEALVKHAAAALTDRETRASLIDRGLRHAARFRWERTAWQMLEVYRDVAERAA